MKINKLRYLCEVADKATWEFNSASEFENFYVDVLNYINENIEYKQEFIDILKDFMLDTFELVAFCMYELRWEEIKVEAEIQRDLNEDWRNKTCYIKIISAFRDDWNCRDMYQYYEG